MKTFFAVLLGVPLAILAAVGILYLISQQQEKRAAQRAFQEDLKHAQSMVPSIAHQDPTPSSPPNPEPVMDLSSATVIASVQIKTIDGPMTIPEGTNVRLAGEKSKPGTVLIRYQGYTLAIPSTAIAQQN